MGIGESIRMALEGLRVNKMRSILTMLGIIIGIAAVIGILTLGSSLTSSVTNSLGSLGARNISIYLQQKNNELAENTVISGNTESKIADKDLITEEMLEKLRERYKAEITGISLSESVGSGKAEDGRLYANVSLSGVSQEYLDVSNVELLAGRALRSEDINGRRNVCVVSDKLVDNLYRGDMSEALKSEIKVDVKGNLLTFRIVGVYKYDASASMGMMSTSSDKDLTTSFYLPVSTAKQLTGNSGGFFNLTVQVATDLDSQVMAQEIQDFLNRYYINNEKYSISAVATSTIVKSTTSVMSMISTAISVIAGISLLVGGIGVMNIMLVSVTERTREIGIRKALGATNNNIRIQFVVESMIVCLLGGVIGILIGTLLGYTGSILLSSAMASKESAAGAFPQIGHIVLAVGFSMTIGIFFGYYPANKAAQLDPIEALRYE